jgi:hypoxanthine-guanine phosphoribosyltransferase
VDTGNTLSCLIAHLEKKGASSISVCTFLDKPARRKVNIQLLGDGKFYSGFEVQIPSPLNTILYGTHFFKILFVM